MSEPRRYERPGKYERTREVWTNQRGMNEPERYEWTGEVWVNQGSVSERTRKVWVNQEGRSEPGRYEWTREIWANQRGMSKPGRYGWTREVWASEPGRYEWTGDVWANQASMSEPGRYEWTWDVKVNQGGMSELRRCGRANHGWMSVCVCVCEWPRSYVIYAFIHSLLTFIQSPMFLFIQIVLRFETIQLFFISESITVGHCTSIHVLVHLTPSIHRSLRCYYHAIRWLQFACSYACSP